MATTRDDEKDKKKKEAEGNDSPAKEAPARESRGFGGIGEALARGISEGVSKMSRGAMETGLGIDRARGNDKDSPLLVPADEARIKRYETLAVGAAADAARVKALADQAELDAEGKYKSSKSYSTAGTLLAGPLLGAGIGLAGNAVARQMAGAAARKKTFDANNMEEGTTARTLLERDSKGDGAAIATGTPKAPVANEAEQVAAKPAAPTFDDFVAKARKRKNYLSTILAGNVSTSTPQGKSLYGA